MGISASVSLTNQLRGFAERSVTAILSGENKGAERLLALSIPRTPLLDGGLRNSGQVENAVDPEEGAAVVFDAPQAARLHEHPEYNFTEPGTGGKWLENTALESKAEIGAILAEEIRNAAS